MQVLLILNLFVGLLNLCLYFGLSNSLYDFLYDWIKKDNDKTSV